MVEGYKPFTSLNYSLGLWWLGFGSGLVRLWVAVWFAWVTVDERRTLWPWGPVASFPLHRLTAEKAAHRADNETSFSKETLWVARLP